VGFRFGSFFFFRAAGGDVVALEFAIERRTADAEHLAGECFVAMCLLENAKDGHALHSARATVDRGLASGGDISSVPGCSVRMAGGILDVDGGFLSALGYWVGSCIGNVTIGS